MKKILPAVPLLLCFCAAAQRPPAAAVLSVEKSFAAHAVAHGTREAFLFYFDSSGVVFENGKAVNAHQTWRSRPHRPGILNWHPVYGAASASGELGFTTGPWTFQPNTLQDSVAARGQYATIWKKNGNGEWKAIVDIGVSGTPHFDSTTTVFSETTPRYLPGTRNSLLNREQKFIRATAAAGAVGRTTAYEAAVRETAFLLNRNGRLPVTKHNALKAAVDSMPVAVAYTVDALGIAAAGDLGYVYGTTVVNGKNNNYLRIWRREGTEWKLALEVLPW